MSQLSATKTLAAFASDLDPASIPQGIKDTLGILLLDHLRVSSMGARLPWADWARAYIKQVAAPGNAHVLFSTERLNAQHAAYLNVAYGGRSEEHTSELQSLMRISYAVFCLKKKKTYEQNQYYMHIHHDT